MAPMTRRDFARTTLGAAAAVSFGVHSSTAADPAPNRDIRVAVVGLGGQGGSHLNQLKDYLVAICDVDSRLLAKQAERFPGVETFRDFRQLLDRTNIDAISIATPNHTHALIGVLAAQAGKDVYGEKPASHHVWEGAQLVRAARKYGRIIQCGTQSRSSPSLKAAARWVQEGNLGPIQAAVGTCYKRRPSIGKLDAPLQIPDNVDYDLWCGPAAKVDLYRPQLQYDWHWDFNTGNGDMGNQGIHQMDIARWFLGVDSLAPRVISVGGRLGYSDAGNTPNTQVVIHAYEQAPLIFETRGLPVGSGRAETTSYRGSRVGVIVQCERGHMLIPSYYQAIAYDGRGEKVREWSEVGDHFKNFLAAVASRKPDDLNAEVREGHLSSALCHLGSISDRLGQPTPVAAIRETFQANALHLDAIDRMLEHVAANGVDLEATPLTQGPWLDWDSAAEQFTGNDRANALLRRQDRAGFKVPEIEATPVS